MSDHYEFNPSDALSAVHGARADLAARLDEGSWSYDLIYSALAGVIVGGQALPWGWNLAASLGGAAALGLLARDWARRKGVWVCGVTPRRARWVSLGLGVGIAAVSGVVFLMTYNGGSRWIALPAALAAAIIALIGSRLWRRVFKLDLAEDFGPSSISYGLVLLLGAAGLAGSGLAHLMGAQEMLVAWLLGAGLGISAVAGAMMLRRALRAGAAH